MADHRLIAYLAGDLDEAARQAVEADLASDPALREELEEWRLLAESDQQRHNADGLAARQATFLRELDDLGGAAASEPLAQATGLSARLRAAWRWLWPQSAGPMLPAGWALALVLLVVLMNPTADRPQVDPIATRGGASCARWIVDLPDSVSIAQLRDVLTQYAVDVTAGPDADGRFVLSAVREASLRGASAALGALGVVPVTDGPCVKPQP